jgi:hypothetical protein
MSSDFLSVICEPYSFHFTNTTALFGLCFAELFTQLIFVLLAVAFGSTRLFHIYRTRTYKVREFTRSHVLEVVFSFLSLLVPVVDLLYTLIAYYGLQQVCWIYFPMFFSLF